MRKNRSIDVVGGAILAALGCGGMACGGSVDGPAGGSPNGDANGDSRSSGCASPTPVLHDGRDTGFEKCNDGMIRRRAALACPRAPNDSNASGPGTCSQDSDCGAGSICLCAPLGTGISTCSSATCVDNSSCGPGHACVASAIGDCSGRIAFTCESAADTCRTSADCSSGYSCLVAGDHRACGIASACTPGRPFLVDREHRRAGVAERADWMAEAVSPESASLSPELRARVADYWTDAALMEHASIAAFARFTLELLALGAPADLVMGAQQAMGDETEHARICFALASAYRGADAGPTKLRMDGVAATADLRTIAYALIREGCIGETLAALEATEAGARTCDGAVRDALAIIARDETKHAELSWRALAWISSIASAEDNAFLHAELERAMAELGDADADADATTTTATDEMLSAHGLLAAPERALLREHAVASILRRAGKACLKPIPPTKTMISRRTQATSGPRVCAAHIAEKRRDLRSSASRTS